MSRADAELGSGRFECSNGCGRRFDTLHAALGHERGDVCPRRAADRWTADHAFVPVNGHPDDDECTFRSDGTDATYCGRTEAEHDEDEPLTDCEEICMTECQGPCGVFS